MVVSDPLAAFGGSPCAKGNGVVNLSGFTVRLRRDCVKRQAGDHTSNTEQDRRDQRQDDSSNTSENPKSDDPVFEIENDGYWNRKSGHIKPKRVQNEVLRTDRDNRQRQDQ
jgi:hypothetical protein